MGITAGRLRELLNYSPNTGVFIWRIARGRIPHGSRAGHVNVRGYVHIKVDDKTYSAHRLAWLWMTGEWPAGDIDHIDGDSINNAWANLRDVSEFTNLQNQRKAHKNSKSGILGVSRSREGRWFSRIRIDGRNTHIGTYETPEEAHAAYLEAKRKHHEGCTI